MRKGMKELEDQIHEYKKKLQQAKEKEISLKKINEEITEDKNRIQGEEIGLIFFWKWVAFP